MIGVKRRRECDRTEISFLALGVALVPLAGEWRRLLAISRDGERLLQTDPPLFTRLFSLPSGQEDPDDDKEHARP